MNKINSQTAENIYSRRYEIKYLTHNKNYITSAENAYSSMTPDPTLNFF